MGRITVNPRQMGGDGEAAPGVRRLMDGAVR
jgi:hypothetical protein